MKRVRRWLVFGSCACGLFALLAATASARYRFAFEFGHPVNGNSVRTNGGLNFPTGLATFGDEFVVGDQAGIHLFKTNGKFVRAFAPRSPLQQAPFYYGVKSSRWPTDVAVDKRGFIYLTNSIQSILEETDFHGRLIHSRRVAVNCFRGCSFDSSLARVAGVAVSPNDRLVYTTRVDPCCGDAAKGFKGIKVYTRTMLPVAGQQFPPPPRFPEFGGLSTDRKGHLYVIIDNEIQERTADARREIRSVGYHGGFNGYRKPIETTEDAQGDVFVSDQTGRIFVYDAHYFAAPLTSFVPKDAAGHKVIPAGISVDRAGDIWVVDENGHVDEYKPTAPKTTITSRPPKQFGGSPVTFKFKSDTAGSTFRCRLVALLKKTPPFKRCTSPVSYDHLGNNNFAFEVQAVAPGGIPDPTLAVYRFTYDSTPPKVSRPSISLPAGQTVGTDGAMSLRLGWSATDSHPKSSPLYTAPSKMRYTLLQWSGLPGPPGIYSPLPAVDNAQGVRGVAVPIAPDSEYSFEVQATNKVGAVGTGSPTLELGVQVFDNAGPSIQYSSGWTTGSDNQAVGGSIVGSSTAGATATITLNALAVGVVFLERPGLGTAQVCVDSGTTVHTCTDVGLGGGTADRQLLFTKSHLKLSDSSKLVVTVQSGTIGLDAIEAVN